jgi:hypothetical protein
MEVKRLGAWRRERRRERRREGELKTVLRAFFSYVEAAPFGWVGSGGQARRVKGSGWLGKGCEGEEEGEGFHVGKLPCVCNKALDFLDDGNLRKRTCKNELTDNAIHGILDPLTFSPNFNTAISTPAQQKDTCTPDPSPTPHPHFPTHRSLAYNRITRYKHKASNRA